MISLSDLSEVHPNVFPAPSPIVAEFFAGTSSLTQAQLDFLTKRHRVPNMALAYDGDRRGWLAD